MYKSIEEKLVSHRIFYGFFSTSSWIQFNIWLLVATTTGTVQLTLVKSRKNRFKLGSNFFPEHDDLVHPQLLGGSLRTTSCSQYFSGSESRQREQNEALFSPY